MFGVVLKEHVFDESFDAIIGLAYPAMADGGSTPLFDTMIDQNLLNMNVFAFYMSLNEYDNSELIFGWIDSTRYVDELKWYPVVNQYFWSIGLTDIKVCYYPFHQEAIIIPIMLPFIRTF